MRKLRYQGRITKLIASKIGEKNKKAFARFVDTNLSTLRNTISSSSIHIRIVSFSSSSDIYEQVLSILSFLRYVGVPRSWTIYSDGSHTTDQIELLTAGFEFLNVKMTNWDKDEYLMQDCKDILVPYKDHLLQYAMLHPLGKKLFVYLKHNITEPTLFLDSDILFYEQASVLGAVLKEKVNGWYLPDAEWGNLDSHYKTANTRQLYQVNSGFMILCHELKNVTEGLDFLKSLNFKYDYFSEQTVLHILLRANAFQPLDPRTFILSSEDQFDFSYRFLRERMAIRHYTGPVRHKMWQRKWKWHLSLSK